MGNLCGKSSSSAKTSDPFAQPGRIVGSSPPAARSSLPPKISSQSPGRPLGSSGSGAVAPTSAEGGSDARQAAAKAAQVDCSAPIRIGGRGERAARANQPKGKLGRELAKGKQQTRTSTLGEASREERRRRDADEGAEARNWN
ncbi:MAG: hypothetical protein Q9187_001711 [Circinaria calcarea]